MEFYIGDALIFNLELLFQNNICTLLIKLTTIIWLIIKGNVDFSFIVSILLKEKYTYIFTFKICIYLQCNTIEITITINQCLS